LFQEPYVYVNARDIYRRSYTQTVLAQQPSNYTHQTMSIIHSMDLWHIIEQITYVPTYHVGDTLQHKDIYIWTKTVGIASCLPVCSEHHNQYSPHAKIWYLKHIYTLLDDHADFLVDKTTVS